MTDREQQGNGVRWPWFIAWVGATILSVLIAYQNLPAIQQAGLPLGFPDLLLRELVVWYSWLLVFPVLYYLAWRFPVTGERRWWHLVLHVLLAPLFVLLVVALFTWARFAFFPQYTLMPEAPLSDSVFIVFRSFFAFFLMVYASMVAALQAWRQGVERRQHTLAQAKLEAMLQESRLENLRAQLDPHFLFNALNAISSLVGRDPVRARQMIAKLSSLLRLSLGQETRGLIPLARELEMLGVYLEIQRLRFGDRLRVALDIEEGVEHALVPQLLLQPLVENAIHHGLERRPEAGRIGLHIRAENSRLRIVVTDDGPGFPEEVRERVGLGNARARLALHFGDNASIECSNRPAGGAHVAIEMPLQTSDQRDAQ